MVINAIDAFHCLDVNTASATYLLSVYVRCSPHLWFFFGHSIDFDWICVNAGQKGWDGLFCSEREYFLQFWANCSWSLVSTDAAHLPRVHLWAMILNMNTKCILAICRDDCHPTRGYCDMPTECRCRLGWSGATCKECQVLPGLLQLWNSVQIWIVGFSKRNIIFPIQGVSTEHAQSHLWVLPNWLASLEIYI